MPESLTPESLQFQSPGPQTLVHVLVPVLPALPRRGYRPANCSGVIEVAGIMIRKLVVSFCVVWGDLPKMIGPQCFSHLIPLKSGGLDVCNKTLIKIRPIKYPNLNLESNRSCNLTPPPFPKFTRELYVQEPIWGWFKNVANISLPTSQKTAYSDNHTAHIHPTG